MQAIWLRRILDVMHHKQNTPTKIFRDNKFVIALSKNSIFHGWFKHNDIQFCKIRELITKKEEEINYCLSKEQRASNKYFNEIIKDQVILQVEKNAGDDTNLI